MNAAGGRGNISGTVTTAVSRYCSPFRTLRDFQRRIPLGFPADSEEGWGVCRELLQLRPGQKESPAPSTRDEQWYTSRPCERLVGCAARIVAEAIASGEAAGGVDAGI